MRVSTVDRITSYNVCYTKLLREEVLRLLAGELAERLVCEGPCGGGYGDARERAPEAVLADVLDGLLTPEMAYVDYGVVIRGGAVDVVITSYSIHYTKLYEAQKRCCGGDCSGRASTCGMGDSGHSHCPRPFLCPLARPI